MCDGSSCHHREVWLLARKGTLSAAGSIPYLALGGGYMSISLFKKIMRPVFGVCYEHAKFHNKSVVN